MGSAYQKTTPIEQPKQVNLKFPADLYRRVRVYAADHDRRIYTVIVEAVERFIEREAKS